MMKLEAPFSLENRITATLILLECCSVHVKGETEFLGDT